MARNCSNHKLIQQWALFYIQSAEKVLYHIKDANHFIVLEQYGWFSRAKMFWQLLMSTLSLFNLHRRNFDGFFTWVLCRPYLCRCGVIYNSYYKEKQLARIMDNFGAWNTEVWQTFAVLDTKVECYVIWFVIQLTYAFVFTIIDF